jgi:uncharacterized protein (TIGR03435 family)
MIKYAYKIVDSQLSGGPDWLNATLFDIEAKTDRPATRADLEPMFQASHHAGSRPYRRQTW